MFGVTKEKTVAVGKLFKSSFKITPEIIRRANNRMMSKSHSSQNVIVNTEGISVKYKGRTETKTLLISREEIKSAYKKALGNVKNI